LMKIWNAMAAKTKNKIKLLDIFMDKETR